MNKWTLVWIWIVLFTLATIYGIHTAQNANNAGVQSRQAICALVHDYETRILSGQTFLSDHPNGIPGIPGALIKNDITNELRTQGILDKAVSCP